VEIRSRPRRSDPVEHQCNPPPTTTPSSPSETISPSIEVCGADGRVNEAATTHVVALLKNLGGSCPQSVEEPRAAAAVLGCALDPDPYNVPAALRQALERNRLRPSNWSLRALSPGNEAARLREKTDAPHLSATRAPGWRRVIEPRSLGSGVPPRASPPSLQRSICLFACRKPERLLRNDPAPQGLVLSSHLR